MEREPLAGPAQSALNLVRDKHCTVLCSEASSGAIKILVERADSALALNRFDQNGTNVGSELLLEVRNVVRFDKLESRYQGLERLPILLARCRGQCPKRPAVKPIVHRQHAILLSGSVGAGTSGVHTRKLQTGFDRFRAAVCE